MSERRLWMSGLPPHTPHPHVQVCQDFPNLSFLLSRRPIWMFPKLKYKDLSTLEEQEGLNLLLPYYKPILQSY